MTANPALLLAALVAPLACSDPPRVGVLDVEQAFARSPLAMVSALQLNRELASTQRDLKRRGRALAERRQQLEHGGLPLSPEQREQAMTALAEEGARLVELQNQYRADLAAAQERHSEQMIARIEEVAREVARREGIALLVRKDDLLHLAEGVDLAPFDVTDAVIRALLEKINPTEIPEPADSEQPAAASG